jgi:hypothetical protein
MLTMPLSVGPQPLAGTSSWPLAATAPPYQLHFAVSFVVKVSPRVLMFGLKAFDVVVSAAVIGSEAVADCVCGPVLGLTASMSKVPVLETSLVPRIMTYIEVSVNPAGRAIERRLVHVVPSGLVSQMTLVPLSLIRRKSVFVAE